MPEMSEKEEFIALIHEALNSYTIAVNGSINETRTLPEWIQILASDTRGIHERRELALARSRIARAIAASRSGRAAAALWRIVRTPLFTMLGSMIGYYLLHWIDPDAVAHLLK